MSVREALSGQPASALHCHRHVCVLYGNTSEEYHVLRSFISEGFPKGDKAFHIIDARHRPEHFRRLEEFGIDVPGSLETGQLEVRGWEEAHLRPGWFDQHAMLSLVDEVLGDAKVRGFPFTRWVANMGWALEGCRGAQDLVEYCSRLNDVVPHHDATIVCTYDVSRFSAATIIDILRTHPAAIIGGVLHENPFFVPPAELLLEIAGDPASSTASGGG